MWLFLTFTNWNSKQYCLHLKRHHFLFVSSNVKQKIIFYLFLNSKSVTLGHRPKDISVVWQYFKFNENILKRYCWALLGTLMGKTDGRGEKILSALTHPSPWSGSIRAQTTTQMQNDWEGCIYKELKNKECLERGAKLLIPLILVPV